MSRRSLNLNPAKLIGYIGLILMLAGLFGSWSQNVAGHLQIEWKIFVPGALIYMVGLALKKKYE